MNYLYVMGEKHWVTTEPPTPSEIEMVIDGDLSVFRFQDEDDPQIFEPIDENDTDSWGCV